MRGIAKRSSVCFLDSKCLIHILHLTATYSNLENHPRLIRVREAKAVLKIKLDPKTGLPIVAKRTSQEKIEILSEEEVDRRMSFASVRVGTADVGSAVKVTITRPKGESAEEKKARKNVVKEERRNRRVEKKATRAEFTTELKKQQKSAAQMERSRMKKL